jgi:hypothetical protein
MDRYFDLHTRACWSRGGKKTATYPKWLAKNTVPIFMQEHHPEVPASIKYPKGRILLEYPEARAYFTNHVAWMIALALTEGVTTIGLFGVNYGAESEYQTQRGSCEFWLGVAAGRGVRLVIPEQCTLLREPALLYGYQSHDEETGQLKEAYRRKAWTPRETIRPAVPGVPAPTMPIPAHLKAEIEAEERDYPRPSWSFGHLPEDVLAVPDDGQVHHGQNGFSARLVALDPNAPTIVPDDGMVQWVGQALEGVTIAPQDPSRSLQAPSNGSCRTPISAAESAAQESDV